MSTILSEPNSVEKCPAKIVDAKQPKECTKNGLVNGLVHKEKHKMNKNLKNEAEVKHEENIPDIKELKDAEIISQKDPDGLEEDVARDIVNNVGKSKKKAKKKKHKTQLDSNENLNDPKVEGTNPQGSSASVNCDSFPDQLGTDSNKIENEVETSPSCSKTNSNSEIICDTISSDIEKLVIKDNSNFIASAHNEKKDQCQKKIDFVPYESELQMPMIMKIIQKDLSEPYSIYTYRYFIHNWPKLCFLVSIY